MFFASDNAAPVPPEVMAALAEANMGFPPSYGADPLSDRARDLLREVLEAPEASVQFVTTGTAANALALAALCPPWGAVICHRHAISPKMNVVRRSSLAMGPSWCWPRAPMAG